MKKSNLKFMYRWDIEILVLSFLLVFCFTLSPFNFVTHSNFLVHSFVNSFNIYDNFYELLANILLFLPFGFGLASLLVKRSGFPKKFIFIFVFIVSAGLSGIVETIQGFLPSRTSALSDVCTNTMGGSFGCISFYWWSWKNRADFLDPVFKIIKKSIFSRSLILVLVGYSIFLLVVTISLEQTTHLRNWNPNFALVLGNEQTGDRPWQGYISNLQITNRSLSKTEVEEVFARQNRLSLGQNSLITSYSFIDNDSYFDQTHQLPTLTWQGIPHQGPQDLTKGVFLNRDRWLSTAAPATQLTHNIRQTSQFTLVTTIATANTHQIGPARIISYSQDSYQRNLTLGQDQSSLVFRLRTRLTGKNGTKPELRIPDIFIDTSFHPVIITYDGLVIRVYIDQVNQAYSFELTPGMVIARSLLLRFDDWSANLKTKNIQIYKALYYGLLFIPLGMCIAFFSLKTSEKFYFYLNLTCVGILAPAVMFEILLGFGDWPKFENQLYAIVMTFISTNIVRLWAIYRYL